MLLRWIVNNYLRDAAQQKVRDVVSDVFTERAPRTPRPPVDALAAQGESNSAAVSDDEEFIPCDVAFVYALGIESGGLVDALKDAERSRLRHGIEHAGKLDGREVVVIEAGMGAAAATRATQAAIDFYQPRWVVSAGFAGALHAELRRGHVLMADSVTDGQSEPLAVGIKLDAQVLAATKGLHVGRLLTVDRLVRTPADRRKLHEQHTALACDMETFAVAQVCRERETRLLCVRIISDAVDDELPPEIEHLLAQKSLVGKVGAAAGAVLRRFSAAKDMWNLREDALKASDRLAKFLRGVVPQLK